MTDLLFDTCFLIDLERELRRGPGKAHGFLEPHRTAHPWISWTVAGEFAEGFSDMGDAACAAMLARFDVLPMTEATAAHYSRIASVLRRKKQLIGTNDLWIAAAGLASGFTLVTNNANHFSRVAGLKIAGY